MRLRDQVIGALNLFRADPCPFDPSELRLGQALADVATIGLLHERNVRRSDAVAEQLQGALNSRVVIEQAKGKLAERLSMDMDQAFTLLRDYARNSNQRLTDVARNFVNSAIADLPPPPRQTSAPARRPGGGAEPVSRTGAAELRTGVPGNDQAAGQAATPRRAARGPS
jgi:hypothetical protein